MTSSPIATIANNSFFAPACTLLVGPIRSGQHVYPVLVPDVALIVVPTPSVGSNLNVGVDENGVAELRTPFPFSLHHRAVASRPMPPLDPPPASCRLIASSEVSNNPVGAASRQPNRRLLFPSASP